MSQIPNEEIDDETLDDDALIVDVDREGEVVDVMDGPLDEDDWEDDGDEDGEGDEGDEGEGADADEQDPGYRPSAFNPADYVDDSSMKFTGHTDSVYSVSCHPTRPDLVMTGGGDDKAYLWNRTDGSIVYEWAGHTDTVLCTAFNADGSYAVTGSMDGTVRVYNPANGQHVTTLEGPSDSIEWVEFHPRGNVVLAGSRDSTIWMWSVPSGKCMQVFAGHVAPVICGGFTPDGKLVVAGSEDGGLLAWNPKDASIVQRIEGESFHSDAVSVMAFHHSTPLVMTGSQDCTTKVSRLDNGKVLGSFQHDDIVEALDFAHTIPLAASGTMDGKLSVWDLTTVQLRQTCSVEGEGFIKLFFDKTSPLIYSAFNSGRVRVWDCRNGKCARVLGGHRDIVLDIALTRYFINHLFVHNYFVG
eukprot:TRINITY_DN6776_c0_g1_i2.p1 TRINITY_DN6776_c0_g1~~TRINITY_DN6776_c0_g1_i2.p1  ORF type:complete len:414 (-),score=89.57 TRINITY_DN6776_c0_g1_i2:1677-2918(-)